MTNGEMMIAIYGIVDAEVNERSVRLFPKDGGQLWTTKDWWNAEYRDCEHCAKTYGTLGCCDTVSNEWVYSCKEGHEEYARGMRKFGSTTKNNLGVDYISRTRAIERLKLNFPISQGADNSRDRHRYMQTLADIQAIRELSPMTPQEPTTKIEESNFSQEQYLADIQSAYDCGKSVIDKIRAEIVEEMLSHSGTGEEVIQAYADGLKKGLDILDKYKAETEGEQ